MDEQEKQQAQSSDAQAEKQAQTPERPAEVLSDKRKYALIWYLGILLLVAFVFVAFSLALQMHNSRTTISELNKNNSSALANVESLQAQNRDLQDEAKTQRDTIDTQQDEIGNLRAQLREAQAQLQEQQQLDGQMQELETQLAQANERWEHTMLAYEALLEALAHRDDPESEAYRDAIQQLDENYSYLSDGAMRQYRYLLDEQS